MRSLTREIKAIESDQLYGRVSTIQGLLVEVTGPLHAMSVGGRVVIGTDHNQLVCETVGFRGDKALCLPFGKLDGVRMGSKAVFIKNSGMVRPSHQWLGRIINAAGEPIDGKGPLENGAEAYALKGTPPPAHERSRVGKPIDIGVRAINTFMTCCRGQRMGIFAGSGVGKSVLLSMLASKTECDVIVIGLIGERGREVQEFIQDILGEAGLQRAVVVVATSDEPALMRRQAAHLTMAVSEYYRDQGKEVLCLMDSLTRFAQAQREIGLSIGEPPTSKGYPPTVFSELPSLLERAGPGTKKVGNVTGLFTVLVEGDNHNEPISDAVRGILDGHIVMEREIAERGRFPAINVLRSVSRTMPNCTPEFARPLIQRARQLMSSFADMEELIRLGAYRKGSDPMVDEAIALQPELDRFLSQGPIEETSILQGYEELKQILEGLSVETPGLE